MSATLQRLRKAAAWAFRWPRIAWLPVLVALCGGLVRLRDFGSNKPSAQTTRAPRMLLEAPSLLEYRNATGNLLARIKLVSGRPEGVAELWWPNGRLQRKTPYRAGLVHGLETLWDEDGHTREEIECRNGISVTSTTFRADGSRERYLSHRVGDTGLEIETWFEPTGSTNLSWASHDPDGSLIGTEFDANGQPLHKLVVSGISTKREPLQFSMQEGKWMAELLIPRTAIAANSGAPERKVLPLGIQEIWRDQFGHPMAEWTLDRELKPSGATRLWRPDGTLLATLRFSQGKLTGRQMWWLTDGALWGSVEFREGRRDGTEAWFFDTGRPSTIERFKRGQRIILEAYHRTGERRFLNLYSNEALVSRMEWPAPAPHR